MDTGGVKGSGPFTTNTDHTRPGDDPPGIHAKPRLSRTGNQTPKSILKKRKISMAATRLPQVNHKAREKALLTAHGRTLQAHLGKLTEQLLLLKNLDELKAQLEFTPQPDCEFSVIYIDEAGQEISVIPPDSSLSHAPEKENWLRNGLKSEIEDIEQYFHGEREEQLAEQLLNTSIKLTSCKNRLRAINVKLPDTSATPERIYCDLAILTTLPEVISVPTPVIPEPVIPEPGQNDYAVEIPNATPATKKQVRFDESTKKAGSEVRSQTPPKALPANPPPPYKKVMSARANGHLISPTEGSTMPGVYVMKTPTKKTTPGKQVRFSEPTKKEKSGVTSQIQRDDKPTLSKPTRQWLEFYTQGNKKIDHQKWTMDQILQFSEQEMETYHRYIQLLFPNRVISLHNEKAPLLTEGMIQEVKNNPALRARVEESLNKILSHWGLRRTGDNFSVISGEPTRYGRWAKDDGDHNQLRVCRVLHFLMATGYERWAKNLEATLQSWRSKYKAPLKWHWADAVGKQVPKPTQNSRYQ